MKELGERNEENMNNQQDIENISKELVHKNEELVLKN